MCVIGASGMSGDGDVMGVLRMSSGRDMRVSS